MWRIERVHDPKVAGPIPARPIGHDTTRDDTRGAASQPREATTVALHTTNTKVAGRSRERRKGMRSGETSRRELGDSLTEASSHNNEQSREQSYQSARALKSEPDRQQF